MLALINGGYGDGRNGYSMNDFLLPSYADWSRSHGANVSTSTKPKKVPHSKMSKAHKMKAYEKSSSISVYVGQQLRWMLTEGSQGENISSSDETNSNFNFFANFGGGSWQVAMVTSKRGGERWRERRRKNSTERSRRVRSPRVARQREITSESTMNSLPAWRRSFRSKDELLRWRRHIYKTLEFVLRRKFRICKLDGNRPKEASNWSSHSKADNQFPRRGISMDRGE